VVEIGEAVIVRDLESGEVNEYRIVGTGEADPTRGLVSHRSPVGEALLRRGKGDVVDVQAPSGRRRLEIVALDG
jgi:transcription elongation factor GreA